MTIAAAIRITSPDEERVIEQAVAFARQNGEPCFVMSVVASLPYGAATEEEQQIIRRNLELIATWQASPVILEGDDAPEILIAGARTFGVRTLFVQSGTSRGLTRSMAERLLYLAPPFDVVIVGSQ
jgi:K+-sensing histidine kinase KdpD